LVHLRLVELTILTTFFQSTLWRNY